MKEKKQSLKSKVTYVKKNWMLYIFFLMPALLLTIIFKYVPMGGLLIAFKLSLIHICAMMAMLVLAILPIVIFYIVCQKYIIEGVLAGAVKG